MTKITSRKEGVIVHNRNRSFENLHYAFMGGGIKPGR